MISLLTCSPVRLNTPQTPASLHASPNISVRGPGIVHAVLSNIIMYHHTSHDEVLLCEREHHYDGCTTKPNTTKYNTTKRNKTRQQRENPKNQKTNLLEHFLTVVHDPHGRIFREDDKVHPRQSDLDTLHDVTDLFRVVHNFLVGV